MSNATDKPAYANETLSTIFNRTSYRGVFADTPVPRHDLEIILRAGIAAPSGCNRQTSAFVAVDDPDKVARIKQIFKRPSCDSAPAFIMIFSQEIPGIDGHLYHVEDFSAAVENMLLAIKSMGYESCWYQGGIRNCLDSLQAVVGMPDHYRLACLLPVGKPAETPRCAVTKKNFEERAWFNEYRVD